MTALPALSDIADEYELLDSEDRYRLLIELGRMLEPMPDALKTDATKVRGCSSSTWVYPTRLPDGRLYFLADSNAAITKGVVALILSAVQNKRPEEVAAKAGNTNAAASARPFVNPLTVRAVIKKLRQKKTVALSSISMLLVTLSSPNKSELNTRSWTPI